MLLLLFIAAIVTVIQARVTFTHSEVLQQTDLDASKTANFKCDNGCFVYTDSVSADMYITDGVRDVNNFLIMGPPYKDFGPTELVPSKDYRLKYKGNGNPPTFVFYAVDKKSPNLDTPVVAVNDAAAYLADSQLSRRFTVLNSHDPATLIAFTGQYPTGYPRIYATGFDGTSEDACKPVYQARTQESALNSYLSISSPILTVDKGATTAKAAVKPRTSEAFTNRAADSSLIFMSKGYVGCSYVKDQVYSSDSDAIVDNFSADVKSLEFLADPSIQAENDAVHVTVNQAEVLLSGSDPIKKHYDGDRFDVTISWYRNNPTSNFAMQFDLGVKGNDEKPTDGSASTRVPGDVTTSSTNGPFFLVSLMIVFAYL